MTRQANLTTLRVIAALSSALLFVALGGALHAAPETPVKVAIFPFAMHTPNDMAYLRDGIRDMLSSRLAWQGKVQVVDRSAVEQAFKGSKGSLTQTDAALLGKSLKADYVLFGSVTSLGQAISIDAQMAPVQSGAEPVTLSAQAKNLDEVIPRINQFAEEINQQIFGRTSGVAKTSPAEDAAATRNPELLVSEAFQSRDRISYLNPNFIEMTPDGAIRQPGLWRSQTFREAIMGMDVGNVDGDPQLEVVTVSESKVIVYKREAAGLRAVLTHNGTQNDRFIWVSLVDLNRDGRDEIYVTNLVRRNIPTGTTSNRVGYGRDEVREVDSFGLAVDGTKLRPVCEHQPYYVNGVALPKRGKVLLGQRKGNDAAFDTEMHEMQLRGQALAPAAPYHLPARCNIYNFAKGDINNDQSDEVLVIDNSNRLVVLSATGDQLWKSSERFGATNNVVEGKVVDLSFNQIEFYYIPSPILLADMNKDGYMEIIVNDNLGEGLLMPEGMKIYSRGKITSLSWNELGLVENWKTQEISGMVTSLRLADLNQDGKLQLLASMVMAKDFLKLWEAKSSIFGYELNLAQAKKPASP